MHRGLKIRIYPNVDQEVYIARLLGCYRLIYNKALDYKIKMYEEQNINVGLKELGHMFHQVWLKDTSLSFLLEHNTKVLKQAIRDMLKAFSNFYNGKSRGVGFPKFKSKYDKDKSARFPNDAISCKNDYKSNRLKLNKQLDNLKFKTSDEYHEYLDRNKEKIVNATLTRDKCDDYYLSITVDGDQMKDDETVPKDIIVGIDLGVKDFVVTSKGVTYENIKTIRSNEKKLKKLQKNLSRKVKGSKNFEKSRKKFAKKHKKIKNKKTNYLHSVTNELLDETKVIVIEDLNVSGMSKNHKMAKSILELSLYEFKTLLMYKAKIRGKIVIEIDRFFASTKLCSNCGYKNDKLTLKDREWTCPDCGCIHHRDFNASINIKEEGMRIILNDEHLLTIVLETIRDNKNITVDSKVLLEYLNTHP